jgi:hypothetical protein
MEIAGRYISRRPSVREGLANDIVNYSKLARAISARHKLKNFDAVLAACRRISAGIRRGKSRNVADLLKKSRKTISVADSKARIRIDIEVKKEELPAAVEMLNC